MAAVAGVNSDTEYLTQRTTGEFYTLHDLEKHHILHALKRCKGNRTHAAKMLDISIRTLRNKLNEYAADGAPIPTHMQRPAAAVQTIAVGETYDFEVDLPPGRQTVWLEVRTPAGKWEAQAQLIVR